MGARTTFAALAAAATFAAGQADPAVVYAESDDETRPLWRDASSSAWGGASTLSAVGGNIRAVVARESHAGDQAALITLDDAGVIRLRVRSGGSWSGDIIVDGASGLSNASSIDAAYEQRSGRLLIASGSSASTSINVHVYDGSLAAPELVDVGLVAPPARVMLVPRPGRDSALLVACDDSTLGAAHWDGDSTFDASVLDTMYTGGANGFDAVFRPSSGEAVVAWARDGDTSVRINRFTSAWQGEEAGTAITDPIERVRLAAEPTASSSNVLVAMGDAADALHASLWDGASWTSPLQIEADLAGADVFAFACGFEGEGIPAIIWQRDGEPGLRASTWDGAAWSASSSVGSIGGDAAAIEVAHHASSGELRAVASSRVFTGDPYTQYVAYSETSTADIGSATTADPVDQSVAGVALPDPPAVLANNDDLNFGTNIDETIAPGVYGHLDVGQHATLRFSAGSYVFKSFDSNSNNTDLIFDTSAGEIVVTITQGDFVIRENATISDPDTHGVVIHVVAGDIVIDNHAQIEATLMAHSGSIDIGNNATIVGNLLAAGGVTVGGGTLSLASWPIPGAAYDWAAGLYGLTINGGSISSLMNLTPGGWDDASPIPFGMTRSVPEGGGLRVVNWREISPVDP